jgi:type IV pilus assembly protein PilA
MIVVAIIGILAAIAIPQYQDYVTRSRWQAAVSEVGAIKAAIGECLQNNNGVVASCDTLGELDLRDAAGNAIAAIPNPPFVTAVAVQAGGGGIDIQLSGGAQLNNCTLALRGLVEGTRVNWQYRGDATACSRQKTGVVVAGAI